jgi:putative ABC transport system permease protein
MISNYLKVAIRILMRQKSFAIINISGLSIGLATFILIYLGVRDDLRYNMFHENVDRIYAIGNDQFYGEDIFHFRSMPTALQNVLAEEYQEIVASTRVESRSIVFRHGNDSFQERVWFADPDLLKMFTFPLTEGDENTAMGDVNSIILSREMAAKYFPETNAVGQTMLLNNEFEVTKLCIGADEGMVAISDRLMSRVR